MTYLKVNSFECALSNEPMVATITIHHGLEFLNATYAYWRTPLQTVEQMRPPAVCDQCLDLVHCSANVCIVCWHRPMQRVTGVPMGRENSFLHDPHT